MESDKELPAQREPATVLRHRGMREQSLGIGEIIGGFDAFTLGFGMLAIALAGLVKGIAGFGFPLIAMPLLAQLVPIPTAIAWMLVPMFLANLVQVVQCRASAGVVRTIWPLLAALLPVMALTAQVVPEVDPAVLYLMLGILIEVAALAQLIGRVPPLPPRLRLPVLVATGGVGGVLGGLTANYGFPTIQVLIALGLSARDFVFAVSLLFLTGSLVLGAGLSFAGVFGSSELGASVLGVPAMVCGLSLGQCIRDAISPTVFSKLVTATLIAVGISMIVEGIQ